MSAAPICRDSALSGVSDLQHSPDARCLSSVTEALSAPRANQPANQQKESQSHAHWHSLLCPLEGSPKVEPPLALAILSSRASLQQLKFNSFQRLLFQESWLTFVFEWFRLSIQATTNSGPALCAEDPQLDLQAMPIQKPDPTALLSRPSNALNETFLNSFSPASFVHCNKKENARYNNRWYYWMQRCEARSLRSWNQKKPSEASVNGTRSRGEATAPRRQGKE